MAKTAVALKPPPGFGPPEFFPEIEQGSDEWLDLRLGIPTASCFSMVVRDSDAKTRLGYMHRLAGELLTGRPAEGKIITAAMERGKEMEPRARARYMQDTIENVELVGFVRRTLPSGRYVGASPDGKVGKRKALEIKTMAPHLMIERLERGAAMAHDHWAQVHGTMFVGGFDEVDLVVYYDGMPVSPRFAIQRDEKVIKEISNAVEIFDHELDKLVKRIRSMGGAR